MDFNAIGLTGVESVGAKLPAIFEREQRGCCQWGRATTRVTIHPLEDPRFSFSTMVIDETSKNPVTLIKRVHAWRKYVQVVFYYSKIFVCVDSVAKRFLFSEKEVWAAQQNKTLEALISSRAKLLNDNLDLAEEFEYQTGKYSDEGCVVQKGTGSILVTTIENLFRFQVYKLGRQVFFWVRNQDKKIVHLEVPMGKELDAAQIAKGSFSAVYKLASTVKNVEYVMKRPLERISITQDGSLELNYDRNAKDEKVECAAAFDNEQAVLLHLNKWSFSKYVQMPHLLTFTDVDQHLVAARPVNNPVIRNTMTFCSVGAFIPGIELFQFVTSKLMNSRNERIGVCIDLLRGFLEFSLQSRVFHGDYKPSNVMISDKGNTTVIDWSFSLIMNEISDVCAKDFEGFDKCTNAYTEPTLFRQIVELRKQGKLKVVQGKFAEAKDLRKQLHSVQRLFDFTAVAKTILEVITKQTRLCGNQTNCWIDYLQAANRVLKELEALETPPEFIKLLREITNLDHNLYSMPNNRYREGKVIDQAYVLGIIKRLEAFANGKSTSAVEVDAKALGAVGVSDVVVKVSDDHDEKFDAPAPMTGQTYSS